MTQNSQLSLAINPNATQSYYDSLSPYPLSTDGLEEYGLSRARKEFAAKRKHIQHNTEYKVSYLVFDVDIDKIPYSGIDAYSWWEDCDAPAPNFILVNPVNGNCHYVYSLEIPVLLGTNSRANPRNLMLKVERGLNAQLKADINYVGLISKNALSDHWVRYTPHNETYTLDELADYVDMTLPVPRKRELSGLGRNSDLFDGLRYWAYNRVNHARDNGTYPQWFDTCLIRCQEMNTFNVPLSYSELKSVAKSVSKWTWSKYTGNGDGKNRGRDKAAIDQWQGSLDLKDKQVLAAQTTNKQRSQATVLRISAAVAKLQASGDRVTQTKVSAISGKSLKTIKRNWADIKKGVIRCTSDNTP